MILTMVWRIVLLHAVEPTEQKVKTWVKAQARIKPKPGEHLREMNPGTKIASRWRGGLTHTHTCNGRFMNLFCLKRAFSVLLMRVVRAVLS